MYTLITSYIEATISAKMLNFEPRFPPSRYWPTPCSWCMTCLTQNKIRWRTWLRWLWAGYWEITAFPCTLCQLCYVSTGLVRMKDGTITTNTSSLDLGLLEWHPMLHTVISSRQVKAGDEDKRRKLNRLIFRLVYELVLWGIPVLVIIEVFSF